MRFRFNSAEDCFNYVVKESGVDYQIKESISGYYKLISPDGLEIDDSACEDFYDYESALCMFIGYIIQRHNLKGDFWPYY